LAAKPRFSRSSSGKSVTVSVIHPDDDLNAQQRLNRLAVGPAIEASRISEEKALRAFET